MLQNGVGIEIAHNQLQNSFMMEKLSPEFVFDPDTCPVVFIHGDRDTTARVSCSIATWEHLRRMGVQSDLHTLVQETHSFERKASPGTSAYTYLDRIWEFLTHKGFNEP
jgi:dipeptidyl aminopeptidase/acylaminoacyl peptidase